MLRSSLVRLTLASTRLSRNFAAKKLDGRRCISSSAALQGTKYYYRAIATEHPRGRVIAGDLLVAFMWYWILYHLWYEPEHLFGEFEYPDTSKWTNEELGIPADDE
ncbi:NADH dehydrogenase [ubiquinone] 1 beta subcomplex subunit 2, mitochondrial-like [Pollicipes pollicipes]|uniref:NADH dehydrogenase [ubiquinone] 1 beta subcomplex subunit 2, mitochondrial-like n=1 Tax=Pollicipes pollicipes TaxID=41117 RepID=UPI0018853FEC|nr:NADH dehydrogenase [ubiquinone] 1 beta subcomplex subunit 2, mitochondrial-like [Pollicipes pollicipes]